MAVAFTLGNSRPLDPRSLGMLKSLMKNRCPCELECRVLPGTLLRSHLWRRIHSTLENSLRWGLCMLIQVIHKWMKSLYETELFLIYVALPDFGPTLPIHIKSTTFFKLTLHRRASTSIRHILRGSRRSDQECHEVQRNPHPKKDQSDLASDYTPEILADTRPCATRRRPQAFTLKAKRFEPYHSNPDRIWFGPV